MLSDVLEDASNDLAGLARLVVQRAKEQWAELDAHIQWCDERIAAHLKQNEQVRQAEQLRSVSGNYVGIYALWSVIPSHVAKRSEITRHSQEG